MSGIELALRSDVWSAMLTVSTGCVNMWQFATLCIIYSVQTGATDADWEPQLSMIGKLLPPAAADAAMRKKAGLSVAIGRAGCELVEPTCQSTGALAGCADRVSAGTRTSPADARTGWDATNAGAGCWWGIADITCCCWCCCCIGGEIGTAKLYRPTPPLLATADWPRHTVWSSGTWHCNQSSNSLETLCGN